MEIKKLITSGQVLISHPPHVWGGFSTVKVMYIVLAALMLPTAAAIYFFGLSALWIILVSVGTAVLVEFSIKRLRKKRFIMDGSAKKVDRRCCREHKCSKDNIHHLYC